MHDIEKATKLRVDEYLGMICTHVDAAVDTNVDPYLEKIIFPLGDSVAKTIALVKDTAIAPLNKRMYLRRSTNQHESAWKPTRQTLSVIW